MDKFWGELPNLDVTKEDVEDGEGEEIGGVLHTIEETTDDTHSGNNTPAFSGTPMLTRQS